MPYRDEVDAMRTRLIEAERARDDALARLARARAALASIVADMNGLPAEAEIPWRSLHGGEPREVTFENATEIKLELCWVSYDGRERSHASLIPGGRRSEQTYVGHLWRMLDPRSGEVVWQAYVSARGSAAMRCAPVREPDRSFNG